MESLVRRLGDELGDDLVAVWLYGSRARGEPRKPESDVDLLIIARGGHRHWSRAFRALTEIADAEGASPAFFSIKVFEPDWVEERRRIESFFIQEVDRDKVVLAGAP